MKICRSKKLPINWGLTIINRSILKRAREQSIVRIEIVNPQDQCEDLALEIQDRITLKSCTCNTKASNPEIAQRSLAGTIARYLENILVDGDLVV